MAMSKRQQVTNSEMIANHLAGFSQGLTRSDIIRSLGVDVNESTVWRWLTQAKEFGLVEMTGEKSNARWFASEALRRDHAKIQVSRPLSKRPMTGYNELWLKEYIPNKSFYLSAKDRSQLNHRAPAGSAPIAKFDKHDLSMFLCGLPFGSSAMEGNGYSLIDTIRLIEEGIAKTNGSVTETKMILNHHEAVRYLIENIEYPPEKSSIRLQAKEIRALHSLLSDDLLSNHLMSGRIRESQIVIYDCAYSPLDIREAIESCLNYILDTAAKINDPHEQSFFLVVHLSYLQPFIDCNKRTARVACNIPLIRAGVPPMSWMGVDATTMNTGLVGVYELNETSLLSEVFVDGYMRSIEYFNIMKHSRSPDEVSVKYHREIRQFVRDQVLHGSDDVPDTISPDDRQLFLAKTGKELQALQIGDEGALIRNKLREGDVSLWLKNSSEPQRDTPRQR